MPAQALRTGESISVVLQGSRTVIGQGWRPNWMLVLRQ